MGELLAIVRGDACTPPLRLSHLHQAPKVGAVFQAKCVSDLVAQGGGSPSEQRVLVLTRARARVKLARLEGRVCTCVCVCAGTRYIGVECPLFVGQPQSIDKN